VIERYRNHLHKVRARGINVFVLPTTHAVSGEAWEHPDTGEQYINMRGSVHSLLWLFVLLHEECHVVARHTRAVHCTPFWCHEYEADMTALAAIKLLQPYAHDLCLRTAKAHIRGFLQTVWRQDLAMHWSATVAEWAGVEEKMEDIYAS
jgi:hypothetical protein